MTTPANETSASRVIPATRDRIWTAWTNPAHLAKWWGPDGFTNTFHEFHPVPGGAWRFTMHGPDGKNYPNESTFVEFAEPERIVLDHACEPKFRVIATFTEEGGGTRVTFRQIFASAATLETLRPIIEPCNEQNLDRLTAELSNVA